MCIKRNQTSIYANATACVYSLPPDHRDISRPWNRGLVVECWSRNRKIVLSKKIIPRLLLSTQEYKWVPVRDKSLCAVAANCAECKRTTYIPVIGGQMSKSIKYESSIVTVLALLFFRHQPGRATRLEISLARINFN